MADDIHITFNFEDLYNKGRWVKTYVKNMVMKVVNEANLRLRNHIVGDLFKPYPGGTTDNSLSTRSGALKKTVRVIPAFMVGDDTVRGGVGIGSKYAHVHFGKSGQVTTITPKTKKFLTIPLPAAMNSRGVVKGGATNEAIFAETFIAKSKAGNLIIFGKKTFVKGAKAGQARGDIVPLFVLKKSVKVPVRVTREDLSAYVMPILGKGLANLKNGLLGSTLGGIP